MKTEYTKSNLVNWPDGMRLGVIIAKRLHAHTTVRNYANAILNSKNIVSAMATIHPTICSRTSGKGTLPI